MVRSSDKISVVLVFLVIFCGLTALVAAAIGYFWLSPTTKTNIPDLVFPTRETNLPGGVAPTAQLPTAVATEGSGPGGKIAYVCQIFKLQAKDQICVINADGTGQRRLTEDDNIRHFYPSVGPDGKSVFFSSNQDGDFRIYELTMDGKQTQVGQMVGIAPEASPDGKMVVFVNNDGQHDIVWLMNRDGTNPVIVHVDAWDPTWSPDGKQILFATNVGDKPQLAVANLDGSGYKVLTNLPELRGRSDWSADGSHIVTYSGKPWQRELFLMDASGTNLHQISPAGGNSQGPSFSPDGQWVAFTAYYGSIGNNNGCEIYIMRIDGSDLRRLTNNNYCDWQPRWGP